MEKIFDIVPGQLFEITVITLFSLIIGLSQKALHSNQAEHGSNIFGTDRTFTFIGILGYILWISDPSKILYLTGFVLFTLFLLVNYYFKIQYVS